MSYWYGPDFNLVLQDNPFIRDDFYEGAGQAQGLLAHGYLQGDLGHWGIKPSTFQLEDKCPSQ